MAPSLHQRLLRLVAGVLVLCTVATAAPLRVATYNVELGLEAQGTLGHDATAEVLARIDADVVALQEVRSQDLDTNIDALAATLGYGHQYASDTGPLDSNNRCVFLSRYPISASTSITSPPGALDMTRTAPAVVIDVPGIAAAEDPTLITVHLKCCFEVPDPFRRAVEVDRVVDYLVANSLGAADNVIILGDFNLLGTTTISYPVEPSGLPQSFMTGTDITYPVEYSPDPSFYFSAFPITKLAAFQADGVTDTTQGSSSVLDHILVSPALSTRPHAVEVYNSAKETSFPGLPKAGAPLPSVTSNNASDHYPIFGDFELTDSEALTLEISTPTIAETDPSGAAILTVTLPTAPGAGESIDVTLSSSDSTEAVPAQTLVTFTTGVSSQQIDVAPRSDAILDGPQGVTFSATAIGLSSANANLTVTDANIPFYTFTAPGETITEAFDGFDGSTDHARWPTSGGAWQGIDDGTASSDGNFAYGSVSDPSLGLLLDSTATSTTGRFFNNTGAPITALQIAYDAEQWRGSLNGADDGWTAELLLNGTPAAFPSLTFTANTTLPTGPIAGGATTQLSAIVSNISVPDGGSFELRFTATPGTGGGGATPDDVFVNEIHYDNLSDDSGEFIEVVVGPGNSTALSDLSVVLYNGSNGTTYGTHTLNTFTHDATTTSGHKIYSKLITGIQNGSPDGFAVVDDGAVLHFLSYEGTILATNGPANGMTSTAIGVSQPTNSLPAGEQSIGLAGNGGDASDFTWIRFSGLYTKGAANESQSFSAPAGSQGIAIDNLSVSLLPDTDGDGDPDLTDPDDDNDSLPDIDEPPFGTDPLLADTDGNGTDDGDEDADGDRQSNSFELLVALTDPLDRSSLFEIRVSPNPGTPDSALLTFPSLAGRTYHVARSHDLVAWTPLTDHAGTGSPLVIPVAGVSTKTHNFFRVGITLP